MAKAKSDNTKLDYLHQNEKKWSKELMEPGWTVLPSIILERQHALGLDAMDLNILLQLVRHWWFSENLPYPSKATIATCMGVSKSTIRKRIARMEKDGLIKRIKRSDPHHGQQSNQYDLSGLIKETKPFAKEAMKVKKEQQNQSKKMLRSKKPSIA